MNIRAKKSLGQHFLSSSSALQKIVGAADILPSDTVLEIGPGKGALTREILPRAKEVIAIEKDDRLISVLRETFAAEIGLGKLRIVHGDILEHDIASLVGKNPYKLVANIPYYITGALLRLFLSDTMPPQSMTLLLQKEVGERIVARDEKESILSVSVKAYGAPSLKGVLKRGLFSPPPSVDSVILHVSDVSKDFFKEFNEEDFFTLVKTGFSSKRKKLSGNLRKLFDTETILQTFEACGVSENARAEDLTLADWKKLGVKLLC